MTGPAARLLLSAALAALAACGGGDASSGAAKDAWELYLARPDPGTYENFIRANRAAADLHGSPHDAEGIEYQVRALEVMAAEAVRTGDANLAGDVTGRVGEIERAEHLDTYDEIRPGAAARLRAARALAEPLTR